MGNKFNQQSEINWSYLNLGKVALKSTNKKQKIHVLIPKIKDCIFNTKSLINNSGKL